jgi:hypothetical protein
MASIESNALYMWLRSVAWVLAACLQLACLARLHRTKTLQPTTLSYFLAGSTLLFAVRDVWTLVWIITAFIPTLYIEALFDSAAGASFLGVLMLIATGYWCACTPVAAPELRAVCKIPGKLLVCARIVVHTAVTIVRLQSANDVLHAASPCIS